MLPLCECGFHGVGKVGNLFSGMITDTLFFLSWHSEFSSHPPLSSTTFSLHSIALHPNPHPQTKTKTTIQSITLNKTNSHIDIDVQSPSTLGNV
jgi:hypothetical protein